jgi:hypothetical protein
MAEPKSTKPVRLEHLERMDESADNCPQQPKTKTTLKGMGSKCKKVAMVVPPSDIHPFPEEKSDYQGI